MKNNARFARLKILAVVLTVCGLALFSYFVYTAGVGEILDGIRNLGFGFLVVLLIYSGKISMRAYGWTLCVEKPYKLKFVEAFKAVVIGESLSSLLPLGILVSGTSKAVVVRKQIPLVVGLSSIAIENLFYSLMTGIMISGGTIVFLHTLHPSENLITAGYTLIAVIAALTIGGFFMVVQEWRFASSLANWLYNRRVAVKLLHHGRAEVLRFEDLIYGFYRRHPEKFLPLVMLLTVFHALGVLEVWFILRSISDVLPDFLTAFLLESVNRIILVVFKLVPFLVGVDEAGAQFITDGLKLGAAVGVTLAIVRKGRMLFWTLIGMALLVKRGLSWRKLLDSADEDSEEIQPDKIEREPERV
ncbi:MAG TPA: lysylphosphatidylglycerol synthase transmembrane domain-containing protein [Pyrinomonadaceae bacterium]|nr:lysylphosphatidylglycerol synthase transmembrane domain-containing protein [Pyrinomonadaceae bacterium]